MELIFSYKYINYASANGRVLVEHLLNMGRRPPTSKKGRKSLGRAKENSFKKKKKKGEREKGIRMGPVSLGGSCERENFSA